MFKRLFSDDAGSGNPQASAPATPADKKGGVSSKDVVRQLSKEFGVNLYAEDGIAQLKQKIGTHQNEASIYKSKVEAYEKEIGEYKTKYSTLETQHEALKLGFPSDKLNDVIALANAKKKPDQTIVDGLQLVKQDYGHVFGLSGAGSIGIGHQTPPPAHKTEAERYMAKNPQYQRFLKQKK